MFIGDYSSIVLYVRIMIDVRPKSRIYVRQRSQGFIYNIAVVRILRR